MYTSNSENSCHVGWMLLWVYLANMFTSNILHINWFAKDKNYLKRVYNLEVFFFFFQILPFLQNI